MELGTEAQKLVWEGAIPLQIHLHESEVTTLPPPPPALVLGPRIGYLPLLIPLIKPHFNSTLPPGVDTVWFDYKGLPLKWNTPTGVLFDLLCAEPERPWNLTAAYIINGNCKNIMNMSQADQLELWRCVAKGNMEGYLKISSKLKLGTVSDECSAQPQKNIGETDAIVPSRAGRIPVRLYVRNVGEDLDDLEDASTVDSWDKLIFINLAVEIRKEEGKCFTLRDAVKTLLPDLFMDEPSIDEQISRMEMEVVSRVSETDTSSHGDPGYVSSTRSEGIEEASDKQVQPSPRKAGIKLIRIQGIEPRWDVPFSWVVNNLMNPEYFLHICVYVGVSTDQDEAG
ncbi:autophagy protein 5 isoform X2 [Magnolia sinica]|uniref:autophagy protein 5 isoform X2 n=1 Tax=Magnolia sinica TaxID=86752 RepID=UPI00265AC7A4|nr:autophagy protein 5 isoform X2 [Magnolia sinica]